ncbi:MAG: hypothetical protein PHQ20_03350 [Candidatus Moranbacteria bacterium]|jgi:hypothetical protein|nr:hypothetical protein [Candidatus Moranbacteria bacterium]
MLKKKDKLRIILAFFISLGLLFWVLWMNIFPSFNYQFDLDENNRDRIKNLAIDNKRFIVFPVDILKNQGDYSFNKINLKIKLKDNLSAKDIKITAYDGFEALLYPIGEEITNQEQLKFLLYYGTSGSIYPNGSIVAYEDSAYLISRGFHLPIFSADVFIRNGFQWEKLIKANSDVFLQTKEGEKFHYSSPHPDNSILKIDNEKYFMVWEKQLRPIKEELLSEVWPDFNWAEIKSNKFLQGNCQKSESSKNIRCVFTDNSKRMGSAYIFEIKSPLGEIDKVEIGLKTNSKKDLKETFYFFVSRMKTDLINKYGKRL